ncbi:hypothetical protein J3R83DRAFT_10658, partial [Lanmaoa asiatica]
VGRFQDSTDKSSTANLKHHAIGCRGKEAVDTAFSGRESKSPSKSIFAAFARKGQQPVRHTHRSHTNDDDNCPANIVNYCALRDLLLAGRPNTQLPSQSTISQDIKSLFAKCQERIGKLLQ